MAASARKAPGGQSWVNLAVPVVFRVVPIVEVLVLAVALGGIETATVVTGVLAVS